MLLNTLMTGDAIQKLYTSEHTKLNIHAESLSRKIEWRIDVRLKEKKNNEMLIFMSKMKRDEDLPGKVFIRYFLTWIDSVGGYMWLTYSWIEYMLQMILDQGILSVSLYFWNSEVLPLLLLFSFNFTEASIFILSRLACFFPKSTSYQIINR